MINLSLTFNTFFNFAIFLLLFIFGSLWARYCFRSGKGYILIPAIIVSAFLLIGWGMLAGVEIDEIEHLHCSWMVYSGLVPFKDFWQHHAPIVWIVLAPFFALLKPSALILSLSRIFFGLIFVLNVFAGWKVAKKAWSGEAKFSMYLLIALATSIMGQFLWIRPDPFATLLLLVFIYFCLEIPGKKVMPSFFAGASFGLAASFIFKQYLLFLLPFIVILKEKGSERAAKISAYLLGFCFGALPLALYLFNNNIIREFVFWVFNYNRKRAVFSVDFPVAVTLIGAWGTYLLLKRFLAFKDNKSFILFTAFYLSILSSSTHTFSFFASYNLGFWYMLCAVVGCSQSLQSLTERFSSLFKRSLAAGLFLSLIVSPNIIALSTHNNTYFSEDKKTISQLIKYGSKDSCLMILPYHPIIAADTSRLYAFWQFYLSGDYPELRKEVTSEGITKDIRSNKPAVALCILNGRSFLRELFQWRFISKDDFYFLNEFFKNGYTIKEIGTNSYFIRNDKLP